MKNTATSKLIDILIHSGAITADASDKAQEQAGAAGIRIEKYLVDNRLVTGPVMTLALAEYLGMPPIPLNHIVPDTQLLEAMPRDIITRHGLLPLTRCGNSLTVAMSDPFDIMAIEELRVATGLEIIPLVGNEKEIRDLLVKSLSDKGSGVDIDEIMKTGADDVDISDEAAKAQEMSIDEMMKSAHDAPVVRMVNMILVEAMRLVANGIHLEPREKIYRLRYRVDGELIERPNPPKAYQNAVISRIKIMSDLNIAERRMPQDGRFRIRAMNRDVDVRISILPTVHGEKIVMRMLDKSSLSPNLQALDLDEVALKALRYAIAQPHGIILVTGPTGSGKTTTLYSCLQELNTPDVNIITCEDPVEYQLAGINQVQIRTDIGLTFAGALRSILRQDPDICLVGEIRDGETAEIAVKAALTGHLVLSTLHTNSAGSAITRLVDMGVEPFLLASSVILAQAQRLFRKLCPACKKQIDLPMELLRKNKIDPNFFNGGTIFKAVGCPKCNNIGYRGRAAIMEVLPVDSEIRKLVTRNATASELKEKACAKGMVTLKESGMRRVKDGISSLEAILKVTGGE